MIAVKLHLRSQTAWMWCWALWGTCQERIGPCCPQYSLVCRGPCLLSSGLAYLGHEKMTSQMPGPAVLGCRSKGHGVCPATASFCLFETTLSLLLMICIMNSWNYFFLHGWKAKLALIYFCCPWHPGLVSWNSIRWTSVFFQRVIPAPRLGVARCAMLHRPQ